MREKITLNILFLMKIAVMFELAHDTRYLLTGRFTCRRWVYTRNF
jgi:hypothetical protein